MKILFLLSTQIVLFLAPNPAAAGFFCSTETSSRHIECSDKDKKFHVVYTGKTLAGCEEVKELGYYYQFKNNLTGELITINHGGSSEYFGKSSKGHYKGRNGELSKEVNFYSQGKNIGSMIYPGLSELTLEIVDENGKTMNADLNCQNFNFVGDED